MQFSDTSNRDGLIQECEFYTGLGDAGISGDTDRLKHFTRLINEETYKVVTSILESQDDWDFHDPNASGDPVLSKNLVADQQNYDLESDGILKVKRVEVTYDGSSWYKAEPFDMNERSSSIQSTEIAGDFATTKPFYAVFDNAVQLYPIPGSNVTNGLKIYATVEIDKFTNADTTQEPPVDEPFRPLIAIGASLKWAIAKGLANKGDLASLYQDYEARLRRHYGNRLLERNSSVLKPSYLNYQ